MWGQFETQYQFDDAIAFFEYQKMPPKALAELRQSLLQAINREIARRRDDAGYRQDVNEQKETSMLKGHEAVESARIYQELQARYQETMVTIQVGRCMNSVVASF